MSAPADLEQELAKSSDRNVLREGADARLAEARAAASSILSEDIKHATTAIVVALEGVMFQLRDADNTQFYGYKGVADQIEATAADAAAAFAGSIGDAFTAAQGRKG